MIHSILSPNRRERSGERDRRVQQLAEEVALELPFDLLLRPLFDELEREHGGGVLERLRLQRGQRVNTAHDDATKVLDRNADRAIRSLGWSTVNTGTSLASTPTAVPKISGCCIKLGVTSP